MDEAQARLLRAIREDLGSTIAGYLQEETCEDIALNEDGLLWVKCAGKSWSRIGFLTYTEAMGAISAIARLQNRIIDFDQPILETILPEDGSRFSAVLPPVVRNPIFSIRSRAKQIYSLSDYVRQGIISGDQLRLIADSIERGASLLISGATGSGKTTLLNACVEHLVSTSPHLRIGLVEDTPELQCQAINTVSLLASRNQTMLSCLQTALRFRFDRLIVGEVRDAAALTMLKAFNTGHPGGMSTIHANDAGMALLRLESLVQEAVPDYDARPLIDATVDTVIHVAGPAKNQPRHVAQVATVREIRAAANLT